jgi:hypothetical protein
MNCKLCDELGLMLMMADDIELEVQGLARAINAFFMYHLSVTHDKTLKDLAVATHEVAKPARAASKCR